MSKVTLISTKRAPTWESWRELKGRDDPNKARLTMTQAQALAIFQEVLAAPGIDDAVQILKTALPSRKVFTHWLGQVGRRQDVRLGKGKGFRAYVTTVVESIRNRDHEIPSDRKEEQEMGKKDQRPVVIVRKNKRQNVIEESPETTERTAMSGEERDINPVGNEEMTLALNGPEKVQESEGKKTPSSEMPPEKSIASVSKVQEYALRNLRVFADCAVQKDEAGVFDSLARNFADKPMLNFWLWKVGYAHLSKHGKNKDLVDFIRVLSREIHRDMKETVGKPIPRW